MDIVQRVLGDNKLSFSKESSFESLCDVCQCAKSHQLPFSRSSSVSKVPLELVLTDVWGSAPTSIGNNKYYISFIGDYSKFTWFFLLKNKSEVFAKFHIF
jgi:hypothetical protein